LEQGRVLRPCFHFEWLLVDQVMPERSSKPPKAPPPNDVAGSPPGAHKRADAAAKPEAAFDLWLERGLHRLFDDIAQEPIPEALLKIIEQDRNSKS
jgi:hypothetical protein